MTRDELMKMAAEKVAEEESLETIEFLFRPQTQFELLLRLCFEGMKKKIQEWVSGSSCWESAVRHETRPYTIMCQAIEVEEFYRAILVARARGTKEDE